MTYFNIIGKDCEDIIYKYKHQLEFAECLEQIEKIKYSIKIGCGGIEHSIRHLSEGYGVDYCDWGFWDWGFSAQRKMIFSDGSCQYDDYDTKIQIYSRHILNQSDYVYSLFPDYVVDNGFADKEEIETAKNDDTYIELEEDELYLKRRNFYIDICK